MILTLLIHSEISSTWTEAEAHVTTTKNKYKTRIHNYLTYFKIQLGVSWHSIIVQTPNNPSTSSNCVKASSWVSTILRILGQHWTLIVIKQRRWPSPTRTKPIYITNLHHQSTMVALDWCAPHAFLSLSAISVWGSLTLMISYGPVQWGSSFPLAGSSESTFCPTT